MDDDDAVGETTPWDLAKYNRVIGTTVDIGVYETCIGDIDNNGEVALPDLATLLGCFGQPSCTGTCCEADLDGDGSVALPDLTTLLSNFGTVCRSGGGSGLVGEGDSLTGGGDPTTEWIRNATIEEILRWWEAGMPPIGDDTR